MRKLETNLKNKLWNTQYCTKSLAHSEHLCSRTLDTWTEPTTVCTVSGYTDQAHVGWRRSQEVTCLLGSGHVCGQAERNSPLSGSELNVYRCFSWSPIIPEESSNRVGDGISILFLVIQIWLEVSVELHAHTTCLWSYVLTLHNCKPGTWVPTGAQSLIWWQAHCPSSWQCFFPVLPGFDHCHPEVYEHCKRLLLHLLIVMGPNSNIRTVASVLLRNKEFNEPRVLTVRQTAHSEYTFTGTEFEAMGYKVETYSVQLESCSSENQPWESWNTWNHLKCSCRILITSVSFIISRRTHIKTNSWDPYFSGSLASRF